VSRGAALAAPIVVAIRLDAPVVCVRSLAGDAGFERAVRGGPTMSVNVRDIRPQREGDFSRRLCRVVPANILRVRPVPIA
jgi:hypothetical protein